MTGHTAADVIGRTRDAKGRDIEEPTYVSFAHEGYCCEGCTEGHDGTTSSLQPVELTVSWRDDLPGGMSIEIAWVMGRKPQKLVLDSWAADALSSALKRAHFEVGFDEQ